MRSPRWFTLGLVAFTGVAACGKDEAAAPPTSPAPACTGTETRLGDAELGTGFFADDYAALGLESARGRRVTFGDVNGDGYPDLVAIETGVTPGLQHLWLAAPQPDGSVRFVDGTAASGILASRTAGTQQTALMVAFADVDNDGDLDLFQGSYSQASSGEKLVTTPNELYLNDGKGTFTLKADSGIDTPWPLTTTAAVFFDYDKDGKLDLFVGAFMKDYPALASYQDELYRGNGDGTFRRVTDDVGLATKAALGAASGLFPKPTYGATACDWNDDGYQDLLVSSYSLMADDLWKNVDGKFENVSKATHFDQDDQANPGEPAYRQGGNGFAAACGDYDNDGDLDVMTAETAHGDFPRSLADRSRILRNTGAAGDFTFERPPFAETGIDRPIQKVGDEGDHGVAWLDFDNDGLLDLVIEQSAYPGNHAYLYHQRPDHTFEDVTDASGVLAAMSMSNGLTVDDVDRDGDLDIVMGSVEANGVKPPGGAEHVHVYMNQIGAKQGFLYLTLKGVQSNRQGIGARITLTAGCVKQTREIIGGRGTFGAGDPAYAHFGLGKITKIDKLTIRWPTNPPTVQELVDVPVNRFVTITEGSPKLEVKEPTRR
jgi:enediyne biosynthesis protein E4